MFLRNIARNAVAFVLLSLLAAMAANAQMDTLGNAYIKNDYIQAGINQFGCFGSSRSSVLPSGYYTPANHNGNGGLGIICSPQSNWPNFYGDYMLPGSPFEGFSITFTNATTGEIKTIYNDKQSEVYGGVNNIQPRTPAFTYNSADYSDVTWHGVYENIFEVDCRFKLEGARIIQTTTIRNITADTTYTDIYFVRGMDPDQENGDGGGTMLPPEVVCAWDPSTKNFIQSQADGTAGSFSMVTANGTCAQSSISLYSDNPNSRVGIAGSWQVFYYNPILAWGPSDENQGYFTQVNEIYYGDYYDPNTGEYYEGSPSGISLSLVPMDASIELVIAVGEIGPGESAEVGHEIRLDQPVVVSFSTEGLDDILSLTKSEGETFTYTLVRQYRLEETVMVEVTLSSSADSNVEAGDFVDVGSLPKVYTLVFEPFETEKTIAITAAYDLFYDPGEEFQLEITAVESSGAGLITLPSKVSGIIMDVPPPFANFAVTSCASVAEGSSCTVTIELDKMPIPELGPAILTLAIPEAGYGMATYGDDYIITPGINITHVGGDTYEVHIPEGETIATFDIIALADNIYEPSIEIVDMALAPVSGVADDNYPIAFVTIEDMTAMPVLTINALNTVEANEGSPLVYTATMTGSTCSEYVTAQLEIVDETAVAPADCASVLGPLFFAPGETSITFTLATVADKILEGDETIALVLSNAVNAVLDGGSSTLQTNGALMVVKQADASEPLTHGSFRIKFMDDEVKTSPTRTVKVCYTITGNAVSPNDYTISPPSPVVIPANSSYVDLSVAIVNNYVVEGARSVTIKIHTPTLE